jgi:hypothetical protein
VFYFFSDQITWLKTHQVVVLLWLQLQQDQMIQHGLMGKWLLVQRTQVYVFIVAKGSMVVVLLV